MTQAGVTQFGAGWCWLAVKDGKIVINEDAERRKSASPRRSYYIDYRNRRPDYLKAFLDYLVNWDYFAEGYEAAMK